MHNEEPEAIKCAGRRQRGLEARRGGIDAHLVPGRSVLDKTLDAIQALSGGPAGGGGASGSENGDSDRVKSLLDLVGLLVLVLLKRRSRGSKDESGGSEETHFEVGEWVLKLDRKKLSKLKC